MQQIQLRAYAKINLGLDVIRRREDGYHEVAMIMQTIRLFDRVMLSRIQEDEIYISTNLGFLPCNQNNIAYKAASLMKKTYDIKGGIKIDLQKKIPVSAGMAGGSTDAAAVMFGMNRMYNINASLEELKKLGVSLGADVPYCLMRGTALAEGIGDKLTKLPPCPDCYVLIVKPVISVSTKFVYQNLHIDENTVHPDIKGMTEAIKHGDLKAMTGLMGNVLESVTVPAYPVIGRIKERLMEYGADAALMSGSGPTVFGLFSSYELAEDAKQRFLAGEKLQLVYVTTLYNVNDGYRVI